MALDYQTIPPSKAGEIAVYGASLALCLAFTGQLAPSDLEPALNASLASVGLKPVPPEQLVTLWGLATLITQDPKTCPTLLRP